MFAGQERGGRRGNVIPKVYGERGNEIVSGRQRVSYHKGSTENLTAESGGTWNIR